MRVSRRKCGSAREGSPRCSRRFNLTNRVNYTGYNGNIGGTTGLVTDLSGIVPNAADLMRQVQIGFRFDF